MTLLFIPTTWRRNAMIERITSPHPLNESYEVPNNIHLHDSKILDLFRVGRYRIRLIESEVIATVQQDSDAVR